MFYFVWLFELYIESDQVIGLRKEMDILSRFCGDGFSFALYKFWLSFLLWTVSQHFES